MRKFIVVVRKKWSEKVKFVELKDGKIDVVLLTIEVCNVTYRITFVLSRYLQIK